MAGCKPVAKFKIPKTLNIVVIMLFLTFFKVTATANAQKLNLTLKDVSLETAFNEIRKQTGILFWYDKEEINKDIKISVSIKNANIKQVLEECLKGLPYTFEIFDKTVPIRKKGNSNLIQENSETLDFVIKGKVIDEQQSPMPGVTVRIKNTDRITQTNDNGEFTINVQGSRSTLQFSYLGYTTAERIIDSEKFLEVTLLQETNTLQSVEINAGYYKVKDRERTGSISKITSTTIEKQPINNPLMALQGRVTGLQITQQTGVPGGGFFVQIRGKNSIANGNDPLYVVDGVIFPSIGLSSTRSNFTQSSSGTSPLSMINPNDIESIEILKDADATAIYGSKGANGVILITTKKSETGATAINFDIAHGVNKVEHQMSLLNTDQYLMMRREAFSNDGLTPSSKDFDLNGTWDQTKYTDWQKVLIGNTASSLNTSLSVTGGNQKYNYLLGGNFYKEGTVFPGNFDFKRSSIHSNLGFGSPLTDSFYGSFSASFSHTDSFLPNSDFTSLILLSPNAPEPYDEFGQLNWAQNSVYQNPMAYLLQTNKSGSDNLIGNLVLNYKIRKNLILKGSVGYNLIKRDELFISPLASFSPALNLSSNERVSYFSDNYNKNWIAEPQITYNFKLGPGIFDSLFGLSFQQSSYQYRTIKASAFNSDDLMENMASAGTLSVSQLSNVQYRYTAAFSRINYSIKDKYFINLTARRDGSSRFAEENRFSNFGALGLAWIFSNEKFVSDKLPFISFGKIRFSYGVTGNDQIPDYGYLQLWGTSSSYQGQSTITPTRIANPTYGWERNKKVETAIQIGLFKDRINVETSYYRNKSSNQLVGLPLPTSTGFSSIQANLPAEVENTGWEFETNFKILSSKTFSWITSINWTIPKNKLLSYPNLSTSTNAINYLVGKPLTILRNYNTYVDQQTGLYTREDYDGNGVLNNNDRYQYKFIGQKFYGGFNSSINYNQLSFDFLISFSRQNGYNYFNGLQYSAGYFDPVGPFVNQPNYVLERWQSAQTSGETQKFSTTNGAYSQFLNARGTGGLSIDDASYLRLKNISISYRFKNTILTKLKIKQAVVSLQGQNIFTISGYKGLDPESQSLATLPPLRSMSLKLNISF